MKINELIIVPSKSQDTTSCGTTYSGQPKGSAQDIVPQNNVSENNLVQEVDTPIEEHPDHSAIAEGVSQILRRAKKGSVKQGFRCSSGPRKGRIVAKPSTCFMKLNPVKGTKIRAKRRQKAGIAGVKLARTKRTGGASVRLKGAQVKKAKNKGPSFKKKLSGKKPVKSRIVRPKK